MFEKIHAVQIDILWYLQKNILINFAWPKCLQVFLFFFSFFFSFFLTHYDKYVSNINTLRLHSVATVDLEYRVECISYDVMALMYRASIRITGNSVRIEVLAIV